MKNTPVAQGVNDAYVTGRGYQAFETPRLTPLPLTAWCISPAFDHQPNQLRKPILKHSQNSLAEDKCIKVAQLHLSTDYEVILLARTSLVTLKIRLISKSTQTGSMHASLPKQVPSPQFEMLSVLS